MTTPCRSPFVSTLSTISPRLAYMRMLRASSEIAAAMTVSAPRSRAMCAMSRNVRTANESMTSSAVTSTMTPRARKRPTRSISASRSCDRSASVSADCMDAIRYWPCLRIGTSTAPSATGVGASSRLRGQLFQRQDLITEQPFRFLDAALQVAYRRHLAQVDADRDKRLGDFRRQAGDDHGRAEQPRRLDRPHEVVRDIRVHRRHTGDVDHDHLRAVGPDRPQQLLSQLARALRIDDADDR